MGCSIQYKFSKDNEIIKSKVSKEFLENNEPIVEIIERKETQKEIKNKKLEKIN